MKVKFSKKSAKFLDKSDKKNKERVRLKIRSLIFSLEKGVIPFRELDIKRLKGEWQKLKDKSWKWLKGLERLRNWKCELRKADYGIHERTRKS
jgi:hypothetical protein